MINSTNCHTELLPKEPEQAEQQGSFSELPMGYCCNTAHTFQGWLGKGLTALSKALQSCTATMSGALLGHLLSHQKQSATTGQHAKFMVLLLSIPFILLTLLKFGTSLIITDKCW